MHNNKNLPLRLLTAFIVGLGFSSVADAEIMLYDKDNTTFSTDGYINAFYVNSNVDRAGDQYDRRQACVKMGFLPNYLGFNMSKQVDDLKLGARASFWVTANDSSALGKAYQKNPRTESEITYQFDVGGAKIYSWLNGSCRKRPNYTALQLKPKSV